jgi:hypothetical protein
VVRSPRHYAPALSRRPEATYRQTDVCESHARELCARMKVIDRERLDG